MVLIGLAKILASRINKIVWYQEMMCLWHLLAQACLILPALYTYTDECSVHFRAEKTFPPKCSFSLHADHPQTLNFPPPNRINTIYTRAIVKVMLLQ